MWVGEWVFFSPFFILGSTNEKEGGLSSSGQWESNSLGPHMEEQPR